MPGILGLLGKIPYVKEIAACAFMFFVGLAVGNTWATERAVKQATTAALDYAAKEEAAVSTALLTERTKEQKVINDAIALNRTADNEARALLDSGRQAAATDADNARKALAAEQQKSAMTAEGLKGVNSMLADQLRASDLNNQLCGTGVLRQLLDRAARGEGDSGAAAGGAEASSTQGANATPTIGSQAPDLKCSELKAGYIDLSEHDRNVVAQLLGLQGWVTMVLAPSH